jgi:ComF family protein
MQFNWAKNLGLAMLDVLLPPQCLMCDQGVQAQGQLCAACFREVSFISAPFCQHCAVPLTHEGQAVGGICERCAENPPNWDRARAALRYDPKSRRLILPLKHADRTDLATPLAQMMRRAGADILAEADLLVPVPLHPSRLRSRRYNQAALLARAVSQQTGVAVMLDALVRLRATAQLGDLNAQQRSSVVSQAIALRRGVAPLLSGQRVVLIDDVLTSGATAAACCTALRAADVKGIDVLVAARVPDPRLK